MDEKRENGRLQALVEALERHIIITRDVIHALNGHSGDRETCEVGPCGPANEALAAARKVAPMITVGTGIPVTDDPKTVLEECRTILNDLIDVRAKRIRQGLGSGYLAEDADRLQAVADDVLNVLSAAIARADVIEEELADGAVARYAEAQGGRAVHRLWRDGMHGQGRDTLYRDVWEKLAEKDQALDQAIALGLLRDFLGHVSARVSGRPSGTRRRWTGMRVRMVNGSIRDEVDWSLGQNVRQAITITGTALGEPVFVEQEWLPVKWDDREDPDFCKLALLMPLAEGV
jgi:hypothetical protein